METSAIKSLGNGIFSIVMTLLILELHVPVLSAADDSALLTTNLLAMWPKFLSCAVSFVVLGVFWSFSHRQLSFVAICDGPTIWLNILFFMSVSLLPFSTALLGDHRELPIAFLFYGGNLFIAFILLLAQLFYIDANRRLVSPADQSAATRLKAVYLSICVAVVVAVVFSLINPDFSLLIFALLSFGLVTFQVTRKTEDAGEMTE